MPLKRDILVPSRVAFTNRFTYPSCDQFWHHVSTSKTKDRMLSGAMIFAFQAPAAVAMADLFAKEGELCCFCPFDLETKNCSQNKKIARWFSFKYFFYFHPYPGVSWFPILTCAYFSKWVGWNHQPDWILASRLDPSPGCHQVGNLERSKGYDAWEADNTSVKGWLIHSYGKSIYIYTLEVQRPLKE